MLNLIVIRSVNLAMARKFYEALGFSFTEERHGTGPKHLACEMPNGVVFEIYPRHLGENRWTEPTSETILGFEVRCDLDDLFERQRDLGFVIHTKPKNGRAIAQDFDGHSVHLTTARQKVWAITQPDEIVPDKHYGADIIAGHVIAASEKEADRRAKAAGLDCALDGGEWYAEEVGDLI